MDKDDQIDAQHSHQFSQPAFEDKEPLTLPEGKQTLQKKGSLYLLEVEQQTHSLIRLLGYGLLVIALIDYVYIVIPLQFINPLWEFQTIGALVEHAGLPLLGLTFVFYRHQGYIVKREKKLLWLLSWVSLLIGLLYLLMVPLGVADAWRIYHVSNTQIAAQVSQQNQQFEQIKNQLNQATSDEQLKQLVDSLASQGDLPQVENPQAFKDQFLAQISESEQSIKTQADNVLTNQLQTLLKDSLKWNLGALTAGVLFIWIWYVTRWTRKRKRR